MNHKQVIILRTDLNMSTGKTISQACHASLGSFRDAEENIKEKWLSKGSKKVVLKIEGKEKLMKLYKRAKREGLPCFVVRDAGKTEIEKGEVTGMGIGPDKENKIDKFTNNLSSF